MRPLKTITMTIIVAMLAAAMAAPAFATELQTTTQSPEYAAKLQQYVNESQEPTPAGPIAVKEGSCPGPTAIVTEAACAVLSPEEPTVIWTLPEQPPTVILHELGHASYWILWKLGHANQLATSSSLLPFEAEFERIIGKVGWKWQATSSEEAYLKISPNEQWADTLASCAWMGKVASGPTVTTPGYGFVLTASQYNEACAFFARILVGPQFTQPTAAPLSPIPYNYTGSALCGARPELVQHCGHEAWPQGFGQPSTLNSVTTGSFSASGFQLRRRPTRATWIVMHNRAQATILQKIVDASQEPTPNLSIVVHRSNCPYSSTKTRSCVAYPSLENHWTLPQIWLSPRMDSFAILGELAYVDWWELDPATETAGSIGEDFARLFGTTLNTWRWVEQVESPTYPTISQRWADAMLSCSWFGTIAHRGQTVVTAGYKLAVSSRQYNATCVFFMKTLTGLKFSPPTTQPLPPIPRNYTKSPLCSARPGFVGFCGHHKKKGK